MADCAQCGKELTREQWQNKYCSMACSGLARSNGKPTKKRAPYTERADGATHCECCGIELTKRQRIDNKQRFCSRGCARGTSPGEKVIQNEVCGHCGVTFRPIRRTENTYCSRECAFKHKAKRPLLFEPILAKVCPICGMGYIPKQRNRSTQRSCGGRECTLEDNRRRSSSPEGRAMARAYYHKMDFGTTHRARAKRYGVEYVHIKRGDVFRRDRWACQACGRRVDRRAKFNSPLAPQLDHIVPISRGGPHLPHNVQLLCRECNSRKRAGCIGSQLRLAV